MGGGGGGGVKPRASPPAALVTPRGTQSTTPHRTFRSAMTHASRSMTALEPRQRRAARRSKPSAGRPCGVSMLKRTRRRPKESTDTASALGTGCGAVKSKSAMWGARRRGRNSAPLWLLLGASRWCRSVSHDLKGATTGSLVSRHTHAGHQVKEDSVGEGAEEEAEEVASSAPPASSYSNRHTPHVRTPPS